MAWTKAAVKVSLSRLELQVRVKNGGLARGVHGRGGEVASPAVFTGEVASPAVVTGEVASPMVVTGEGASPAVVTGEASEGGARFFKPRSSTLGMYRSRSTRPH